MSHTATGVERLQIEVKPTMSEKKIVADECTLGTTRLPAHRLSATSSGSIE
jgi:hypothetical protein